MKMSGIDFRTEGVRERWGRDEWNGKLTQRCKSSTGYDCGFLKSLENKEDVSSKHQEVPEFLSP